MRQGRLGPVRPLARYEDDKYHQVGSCVLVRLGTELFVFSAAHVLDEVEDLYIAGPNGFGAFGGDLFKTSIPEGGSRDDDPLDVGILRVTETGGEFSAAGALGGSDLALDDSALGTTTPRPYLLVGFPAAKAWWEHDMQRVTYEAMVLNTMSLSPERYIALELEDQVHVAVEFDQPNVRSDDQSAAPLPHGASGGGIFETSGRLVAIATETEQKAIFGTRVELFCRILRERIPALRDQMPKAARQISAESLCRAMRPRPRPS